MFIALESAHLSGIGFHSELWIIIEDNEYRDDDFIVGNQISSEFGIS